MTLPPAKTPLHRPAAHESAVGHVTGAAVYVDDIATQPGLVHGVLVRSTVAAGILLGIDCTAAAAMPGVLGVYTADDVPGDPDIGPIVHDEPILAHGRVCFVGQPLALVLAETREQARLAAAEVTASVSATSAILSIDQAIAAERFHGSPHIIARGDVQAGLDAATVVVEGEVSSGGQDHFYLETHASLAQVDDDGAVRIFASTQHPTEAQKMAARVLGIGSHMVSCEVPRMGGGFGGKESQSTAFACLAALGAVKTGRPCKVWLPRHEDMATTGGRHPFFSRYRAGFDAEGRFLAFDVHIFSDGGWTQDLSIPVMDRALFHLDNAYYMPALRFEGRVCHTDKPSSTAFRGFGGPQGMVVVEQALRQAARELGIDGATIRRRNYYDAATGDRTPFGQHVPEPRIAAMHDRLVIDAGLAQRRLDIDAFNISSTWSKRGLGLMPVKFGISFTNSLLNQAGALAQVYSDGTVQLNHGGTEMGQGLHTKMRAVACDVLGVEPADVRVMRTSTEKVPNTSPTAASSGTDLNGQAVRLACQAIKDRMAPVAATALGCSVEALRWECGQVHGPDGVISFASLATACWLQRVSLSSTGFYATPGIAYDRDAGRGTPFFYFAYGVALIEVEVLGLTGEQRLRRVDILHDVGDSLVPSIDIGQVEGAFVQGLGWLTDEAVLFDDEGRVLTRGPSTYKIPSVGDIPLAFNVQLLEQQPQPGTIGGSKAVGEPPFMLAIGVLGALEDAITGFGPGPVELALPATPEAILRAVERARGG